MICQHNLCHRCFCYIVSCLLSVFLSLLQLLGDMLLDRSNSAVMTRYVSSRDNLRILMNLLRVCSFLRNLMTSYGMPSLLPCLCASLSLAPIMKEGNKYLVSETCSTIHLLVLACENISVPSACNGEMKIPTLGEMKIPTLGDICFSRYLMYLCWYLSAGVKQEHTDRSISCFQGYIIILWHIFKWFLLSLILPCFASLYWCFVLFMTAICC